jgi:hypothetical protein
VNIKCSRSGWHDAGKSARESRGLTSGTFSYNCHANVERSVVSGNQRAGKPAHRWQRLAFTHVSVGAWISDNAPVARHAIRGEKLVLSYGDVGKPWSKQSAWMNFGDHVLSHGNVGPSICHPKLPVYTVGLPMTEQTGRIHTCGCGSKHGRMVNAKAQR